LEHRTDFVRGSAVESAVRTVVIIFLDPQCDGFPCVDALHAAQLSDEYEFEYIFTAKSYANKTPEPLRKLAPADPQIRSFRFWHNLGYQRSILTTNLKFLSDAMIQIDFIYAFLLCVANRKLLGLPE
jgi:hypothetical protein